MIELINVSKYYPTEFGRHYVFRDVSLKLPLDKSVGVLGPNGAGKSTFLRLLGGADIPSEGKIIKTGSISPPMGLTPGLQASLTASENARFAGRIYGLSRDEINDVIEFVRDLAGIGKFFDMPVGTYSSGMRQRVSFAINMSLSFDYYLFDEISAGGDKEFRKISKQMVEQRLKTSKFIVASHRVDELLELCDAGIIIQNGELTYFDDIKEALNAYGETGVSEGGKARRARSRKKSAATEEAGAGVVEANAQPSEEEKQPKKERRISKRRNKRQDVQLAAPQEPGVSAEAPPPRAKRSRRKARGPETLALAEPSASEPGEIQPPAVAVAAEVGEETAAIAAADMPAKRQVKTRQRKTRRTSRKSRATEIEAGQQPDVMPVEESSAELLSVVEHDRATRQERRRAKNHALVEKPNAPEGSEDASVIIAAGALEGSEEITGRKVSTRARRRARRLSRATAGEAEYAAPEPEAETQQIAEFAGEPDLGAGMKSKKRTRRRARKSHRQASLPLPEQLSVELPDSPAIDQSLTDRKHLRRAIIRQEKAQASAAEAIGLLLRHLEDGGNDESAALAVSAQQRAELSAAISRSGLDENTEGEPPRQQRRARRARLEPAPLQLDAALPVHTPAERPDFT